MSTVVLTTFGARDASVAERIAEDAKRWRRSIFDAPGGPRCSWRQHMSGATSGFYGYLNSLAREDSERFAFCSLKKLCKKGIPYSLRDRRDSYTERTGRDVIAMLVKNEIIIPAKRFRLGEMRKGWIVREHDEWTVETFVCQLLSTAEIYARYKLEYEPAIVRSPERAAFWREKRHAEGRDILRRVEEKRARFARC